MKNFHALTMFFAAGTAAGVPAFAADGFVLSAVPPERETEYIFSAGYEFVYGNGNKDATEAGGDKPEYFGLNLRFSIRPEKDDSVFSPEYFVSLGFLFSEVSIPDDRYGDHEDEGLDRLTGIVGANLRCELAEAFSLYAGARVGIDYFYDPPLEMNGDGNETGLIYGVGCGAEFSFGKYFALTLGADYLCFTAQAERCGVKTNKQNCTFFSVGWKVSF